MKGMKRGKKKMEGRKGKKRRKVLGEVPLKQRPGVCWEVTICSLIWEEMFTLKLEQEVDISPSHTYSEWPFGCPVISTIF